MPAAEGMRMIVVTGGAGFIGSAVVWKLNTQGFDDIVIVEEPGQQTVCGLSGQGGFSRAGSR